MRDPRKEAFDRLGGRFEVRVLEPSPPAIDAPPWFADDPVGRGRVPEGRKLVSPAGNGDLRWDDVIGDDATLADWCGERWLGAYRRLGPPPDVIAATRRSLHGLAERVISPARRGANGKIGLRYTHRGFGTPFYGPDVQVRVEDTALVVDDRTGERRVQPTSLAEAAAFVGVPLETEDEQLEVDPAAAAFLANWFGFTASVLEEVRAEGAGLEPSRVQLWPEHFDVSTELGAEAEGLRAGYGGSPGDEHHEQPYLYVVPWVSERASGELWGAKVFAGAELSYAELLGARDQREVALEFMRRRLSALAPL